MMTGIMSAGTIASSVSLTLIVAMHAIAKMPPATVLVRYMMAGPDAMRTAPRSLVRRAMMSPVRV